MSDRLQKILEIPPTNAWLLFGDEASFPTASELRDNLRRPLTDNQIWTGSKQTQPGDLLFFYFLAPRKAIHFAARAAAYPFFDSKIGIESLTPVDPNKWWVKYTPLIKVTPVSFAEIKRLMDRHLILHGESGRYLRPSVVRGILDRAVDRDRMTETDLLVFQEPVGSVDLPDPAQVRLADWKEMADGPLKLEPQVEQYVVEPLLRLALPKRRSVSWQRQYKLKSGIADYVVLESGSPRSVIEVKVGVSTPRDGDWSQSSDFKQVLKYARELDVPAALIDCNKISLIAPGASAPTVTIERDRATADDLRDIGRHLTG
jgi:hypothetical protein